MSEPPIVGMLERVTDSGGNPVSFTRLVDTNRELFVHVAGTHDAVRLDPSRPDAKVFERMLLELLPYNLPVFLECEADPGHSKTKTIVNVGVPDAVRVGAMSTLPSGDVAISLYPLAARRVLPRDSPSFQEWFAILARAMSHRSPVYVTTKCPDPVIEHVVAAPANADPFGVVDRSPAKCLLTEPDLLKLVTVMDQGIAGQTFLDMRALACDPAAVDNVCTPFAYAADGCDARAHEMCRRLVMANVVPAKVWLVSGSSDELTPLTPNIPRHCFATWDFHVAPIVRVTTTLGDEWRVIDPSLFNDASSLPTIEEWKARQRDDYATYRITEAGLMFRDYVYKAEPDICDPQFLRAQPALAKYRACLICQVRRYGLPPYCH